jgi:hypothetical protein
VDCDGDVHPRHQILIRSIENRYPYRYDLAHLLEASGSAVGQLNGANQPAVAI